jgi:hypothetical protein
MAANLVSVVMEFLTPDMIAKIASALGIDRSLAQKAIGGSVPALLASFANVASTPSGARQLSNAVEQQPGPLEILKSVLEGGQQKAIVGAGSNTLAGLFGGGALDALASTVGSFAGLNPGTVKTMLGVLGPVVLGALGQQQRAGGLGTGGLASTLASQKDQLAAAIPANLASQLSSAGLLDKIDAGTRAGASTASAAASRVSSRQAIEAERTGIGGMRWSYVAATVAALALLAWYFLGQQSPETVAVAPKAATSTLASGTIGSATPSLTVGGVNLANELSASVDSLKSVLPGITDAASARAALPAIREATSKLNEVSSLIAKLPPDGRAALGRTVASAMPTINQMCDKVLAIPGVGDVAKPVIDELKGQFDALSHA